MGNCQATTDVVGVLLEHPDGRLEHLYWSVTAGQVMLQYPGNYVALVAAASSPDQRTLRVASNKLKLLPPDSTLLPGQHYRLVSFEDVLNELSEQKIVGLSRSMGARSKRLYSEQTVQNSDQEALEAEEDSRSWSMEGVGGTSETFGNLRSLSFMRTGQWRPALQSISELGR